MDRSTGGHKSTAMLTIALLAVGMYFLPATLSIFSGQHTFYDGENVSCKKCHYDIYNEIYPSGEGAQPPHWSNGPTCTGCHRTGGVVGGEFGMSIGYKETNVTSNPEAHAAVTVECIFCHDLIEGEIKGSEEAHGAYYNATNQSSMLKGGNEACVGCHTHATLNVTWVRPSGYNMNADITGGYWNLSFSVNQTKVNSSSAGE